MTAAATRPAGPDLSAGGPFTVLEEKRVLLGQSTGQSVLVDLYRADVVCMAADIGQPG